MLAMKSPNSTASLVTPNGESEGWVMNAASIGFKVVDMMWLILSGQCMEGYNNHDLELLTAYRPKIWFLCLCSRAIRRLLS